MYQDAGVNQKAENFCILFFCYIGTNGGSCPVHAGFEAVRVRQRTELCNKKGYDKIGTELKQTLEDMR